MKLCVSCAALGSIICGLIACSTEAHRERIASDRTPLALASEPAPSATGSLRPKAFGAPISPAPVLSLGDVLAAPERFRDQSITVEGLVRSACTRRGCWMEVAQGPDPKLPGCRVTFKDYGFFVPTDSAGARAKVQGTLGVTTLPAERVAHLESEGGQFPHKHTDGSAEELRLVATGVELWH